MGFLRGHNQAAAQSVAPANLSLGAASMPALKIDAGPDPASLDRILQDASASLAPGALDIAQRPDGNVLSRILSSASGDSYSPDISNANTASAPGAPRRSLIDTIGRISDVIAKVGGADPLYQSTIDANTARDRASEAYDWENKFNQQKFAAGENELQGNLISQAGQMARGLSAVYQAGGAPALQKAFPLIAQQLGIKPEQAALWSKSLADDPEGTLSALVAATKSPNSGTDPKEITLYNLMHQQDPALAVAYLKRLANPNAELTPYQRAQLALAERKFNAYQANADRNFREGQYRFDNPHPKGGAAAGGAADPTLLNSILTDIGNNYKALAQSGGAVRQGGSVAANVSARARSSGVGQLIEGALGTKDQTYRDNIKAARPALAQALAKAYGMKASQLNSDRDIQLLLDQVTDPTRSYESNLHVMEQLKARAAILAGQGGSAAPAAPSPGRRTPRPGTPAPRRGGQRTVTATNW